MMRKRTITIIFLFFVISGTFSFSDWALALEKLKIASTTSIDNSGLFEVLNPLFEERFNCQVQVIAVGTGKALQLAANGDVDLVFVHSKSAEEEFIRQGYGVNRREVMYNDFVILGPPDDPAGIREAKSAEEALAKIAEKKHLFISRGDNSGTHIKEINLWKASRINPEGKWYLEAGQGMAAVINMADQKYAYTLSDRATYLVFSQKIKLKILFQHEPHLFNPYAVIAVNPARFLHVNYLMAMAYIGWITSPQGQKIIGEFGKDRFGQPLFVPLAISTTSTASSYKTR